LPQMLSAHHRNFCPDLFVSDTPRVPPYFFRPCVLLETHQPVRTHEQALPQNLPTMNHSGYSLHCCWPPSNTPGIHETCDLPSRPSMSENEPRPPASCVPDKEDIPGNVAVIPPGSTSEMKCPCPEAIFQYFFFSLFFRFFLGVEAAFPSTMASAIFSFLFLLME